MEAAVVGRYVSAMGMLLLARPSGLAIYTHHNSKFRLSENILGPYLKVPQSPILAILQYCCGLAQSQLPNMTPICFQRKRNFELRWVYCSQEVCIFRNFQLRAVYTGDGIRLLPLNAFARHRIFSDWIRCAPHLGFASQNQSCHQPRVCDQS